ncbi:helix-turn-helix transcriptional regulator [Sphingobium sp. DN12]|uniref:helix-turn-helix transcriptional regulator n=1 Tax=Sphingobium sp. DN12 TaxID=3378073 RepID=UPI003DA427F1
MACESPENLDFDNLPDSAFVREPVVSMLTGGAHRSTIWRWVRAGKFPAPRKLAPQTSVWNVGELRQHFASLVAA